MDSRFAIAMVGVLLALAGCASAPPLPLPLPLLPQASVEDRAREIFLYQSRIADALLDRYPLREDFASAPPRLIEAEAAMTDSCAPLTRAVLDKLEGEQSSFSFKLDVAASLDRCEQAAHAVQQLLGADHHALASAAAP